MEKMLNKVKDERLKTKGQKKNRPICILEKVKYL